MKAGKAVSTSATDGGSKDSSSTNTPGTRYSGMAKLLPREVRVKHRDRHLSFRPNILSCDGDTFTAKYQPLCAAWKKNIPHDMRLDYTRMTYRSHLKLHAPLQAGCCALPATLRPPLNTEGYAPWQKEHSVSASTTTPAPAWTCRAA